MMVVAALLVLPLVAVVPAQAATTWDVSGNYVVNFDYNGTGYPHDMTLAQNGADALSGNGGNPAGGAHVYTWVIDSGTVSGDAVTLTAHYTASADAVTPLTTMVMTGTIAGDGSMSGTWTDNYQNGDRSGTWMTTGGNAVTKPSTSFTKDQCKKDGWKSIPGHVFKNQGQCVSYVQTN